MGRHIHLTTHLSVEDLEQRYRAAHEPHERSWWQSLFEVELAAFACQVGASPTKLIILVLECTGWHISEHLRAPENLHLLFLPPYSPKWLCNEGLR